MSYVHMQWGVEPSEKCMGNNLGPRGCRAQDFIWLGQHIPLKSLDFTESLPGRPLKSQPSHFSVYVAIVAIRYTKLSVSIAVILPWIILKP